MTISIFVLAASLSLQPSRGVTAQEQVPLQTADKLSNHAELCSLLSTELSQMVFATSTNRQAADSTDARLPVELVATARQCTRAMLAASDLHWLFDRLSASTNRIEVISRINFRLQDYVQQMKASVQDLNRVIAGLQYEPFKRKGTQLQRHLLEAQTLLQSTLINPGPIR